MFVYCNLTNGARAVKKKIFYFLFILYFDLKNTVSGFLANDGAKLS